MKAELHWYVAQVMTGSEQETARKLTDAGMEALAPVQILHERRHGKWWPIRRVVFPTAGSGVFSAYILAIGRALGETMTVTMLIGNTNQIPTSLTTTGNTMASIIANQFGEADGLKLSALIAIGLILFLITAIINLIGKILIRRAQHV